jgi:hypothetical protein
MLAKLEYTTHSKAVLVVLILSEGLVMIQDKIMIMRLYRQSSPSRTHFTTRLTASPKNIGGYNAPHSGAHLKWIPALAHLDMFHLYP